MKRLRDEAEISQSELQSLLSCTICKDVMTDPVILKKCLHRYCRSCIAGWYAKSSTEGCYRKKKCPNCNTALASKRSWEEDPIFSQLVHTLKSSIPINSDNSKTHYRMSALAAAEAHRRRVVEIRAAAEIKRKELHENPPPPPDPVVKKQSKRNKKSSGQLRMPSGIAHVGQRGLDDEDEMGAEIVKYINIGIKQLAEAQPGVTQSPVKVPHNRQLVRPYLSVPPECTLHHLRQYIAMDLNLAPVGSHNIPTVRFFFGDDMCPLLDVDSIENICRVKWDRKSEFILWFALASDKSSL